MSTITLPLLRFRPAAQAEPLLRQRCALQSCSHSHPTTHPMTAIHLHHQQPSHSFATAIKISNTVSPPKHYASFTPQLDLTQSMYPYLLQDMQDKDYTEEEIAATQKITALSTANNQQLLTAKLNEYRTRYGLHDNDSGNVAIQAAALTERVENMRRHLRERNTDIHARRTMAQIIQKRRKLLLYMRRHHWPAYRQVMLDFGINEEEILTHGQTVKSGAQKVRQIYKH